MDPRQASGMPLSHVRCSQSRSVRLLTPVRVNLESSFEVPTNVLAYPVGVQSVPDACRRIVRGSTCPLGIIASAQAAHNVAYRCTVPRAHTCIPRTLHPLSFNIYPFVLATFAQLWLSGGLSIPYKILRHSSLTSRRSFHSINSYKYPH
jgi:hypothetical protein